jgi:hypothetical protein
MAVARRSIAGFGSTGLQENPGLGDYGGRALHHDCCACRRCEAGRFAALRESSAPKRARSLAITRLMKSEVEAAWIGAQKATDNTPLTGTDERFFRFPTPIDVPGSE